MRASHAVHRLYANGPIALFRSETYPQWSASVRPFIPSGSAKEEIANAKFSQHPVNERVHRRDCRAAGEDESPQVFADKHGEPPTIP